MNAIDVPRALRCCSPEARALLRLAEGSRPAASDGRLREAFGRCDPERLLELATREGALAPLAAALDVLPEGVFPASIVRRASRLAAVYGHRQAQLREGLREAVALLAAADVEAMLLKGAALVDAVYGDFPARPMADLDLLVRPSEAERAHRVLEAEGWRWDRAAYPPAAYAGHHHLPPLGHPRRPGVELEVHRSVLRPGHPFEIADADFWSSCRAADGLGVPAWRPALPHLTLHLGVHFAWSNQLGRDGWRSLRDARALAEAMSAEDWEALLLLAETARAGSCVYWTLRLARTMAAAPVPRGVLERIVPELPAPVLAALERHHATVLFGEGGCPSLRLRRWMWTLGMRPGESGHGGARPWSGGATVRLPRGPRRGGRGPADVGPGGELSGRLGRLSGWGVWARAVLGAGSPVG